ncbi:hypothetical protein Glove_688g36 [Diversispora epigaea]|uniref:LYR motif-containing protein Cup1-like N-terminal domain-containing protein n=1 Tax=Diversispora epigaea TaxID=1348612 RepID=A0A397G531_9GLOM|nr:hypothetical protein Glove_688g36 [Diversispora epigaea]
MLKNNNIIKNNNNNNSWILQRLRCRPRRPFWKLPQHRLPVLSLYKTLLKITELFPEAIHRKYLFYTIRDKFRYRRHETSVTNTTKFLEEAKECRNTLLNALKGDKVAFQHIDDLAWGRKGRLQAILTLLRTKKWKTKTKANRGILRIVSDTRSMESRKKDPHPAYKIPLDRRLYSPPRIQLRLKPPFRKVKKHPWRSGLVRHKVTTQLGYRFWRTRGWKQPVWISMMMKKRIAQHQKKLNRFRVLESHLEMIRVEESVMKKLDRNLSEDIEGFDDLIVKEMKESRKFHDRMIKLQSRSLIDNGDFDTDK